jgi:hypothetical protein
MTINYPLGSIKIKALGSYAWRWLTDNVKPEPEPEPKEGEFYIPKPRMSFNLKTEKVEELEINVDWVSHGNYAVHGASVNFSTWVDFEPSHFDEIIQAFETARNVPRTLVEIFKPFWEGIVPPRGMCFWAHQSRCFVFDKDAFVIHQMGAAAFHGNYPTMNGGREMIFAIDDFKKIRDIALSDKNCRPFHCVTIS